MKRLALLALAAGANVAAAALAMPGEISAEYELTSRGIPIGRVNESFSRQGEAYRIESVTRSEGVLKVFLDDRMTLQSSGRVGAEGLVPHSFTQRRAKDGSRDIQATFDWERGVLASTYKGEKSEVPLPRGTQDRLSLMYQFMHIPKRGSDVVIAMSNGRKVEHYRYRLVDEPRLTTPAGEFETLHYERVVATPRESHAEVWLAKDRHNFPVRVVFDDQHRGLRLEQTLLSLRTR